MSTLFVSSRTLPSGVTNLLMEYGLQEAFLGGTIVSSDDAGGDTALKAGYNLGLSRLASTEYNYNTRDKAFFSDLQLDNIKPENVILYSGDGASSISTFTAHTSDKIKQVITTYPDTPIVNLGANKPAFSRLVTERRLQLFSKHRINSQLEILSFLTNLIPNNCLLSTDNIDTITQLHPNAILLIPKDAGMGAMTQRDIKPFREYIRSIDMQDKENKTPFGQRVGEVFLPRELQFPTAMAYTLKASGVGGKYFCDYFKIKEAFHKIPKHHDTIIAPYQPSGLLHACWLSTVDIYNSLNRRIVLVVTNPERVSLPFL
ncbi:hypothetical protein AB4571_16260 [Vibrio breoganii]|uniref:hypothetical protein n=1 Tax=Vibrio breoganii TaxID=553239 RepID=UPI000C824E79|nr:hypothetical protein [Vibrio breoganii]PML12813.1 hypothetical protein BCT84_02705 [Vibrio breoganii]